MKLNLEVKNDMERRIFDYLEENASETLIGKINNGVLIEKDGKKLINKKTLSGFVAYATDEAKKLAEKGARGMFVDDPTVYGWAIHYFEEDSIEGTLYNEDGTEYKPAKTPTKSVPSTTKTVTPKAKKKPDDSQFSLFDMMMERGEPIEEQSTDDEDDDMPSEEEIQEILQGVHKQELAETKPPVVQSNPSPVYLKYKAIEEDNPEYIVAYRLGDFYEIFGKNAVTVAHELDLTLTGRDVGLPERIPMVGFPYHVAEVYLNKIAKNHKVLAYDSPDVISYYPPLENDDFDLTESEMREFDGDVDDEKHWVDETTYVDNDGEVHHIDDDDELKKELDFAKAFEKTSLCIIDELLGKIITLG